MTNLKIKKRRDLPKKLKNLNKKYTMNSFMDRIICPPYNNSSDVTTDPGTGIFLGVMGGSMDHSIQITAQNYRGAPQTLQQRIRYQRFSPSYPGLQSGDSTSRSRGDVGLSFNDLDPEVIESELRAPQDAVSESSDLHANDTHEHAANDDHENNRFPYYANKSGDYYTEYGCTYANAHWQNDYIAYEHNDSLDVACGFSPQWTNGFDMHFPNVTVPQSSTHVFEGISRSANHLREAPTAPNSLGVPFDLPFFNCDIQFPDSTRSYFNPAVECYPLVIGDEAPVDSMQLDVPWMFEHWKRLEVAMFGPFIGSSRTLDLPFSNEYSTPHCGKTGG